MSYNKKRLVIRIKKSDQPIRLVTIFAFLTVVCQPFHTIQIAGVGLLMLVGLPLLMLSVPALLSRFRRTSWDKATIVLAGFFVYNLFAYLWTPSFSPYSLYNYIKIIAIVMCLYTQAYNKREKNFLLFGAVLVCLIVFWFMMTGNNTGYKSGRMTVAMFGVVQDPNYVGYLFLVPMAVAIGLFLNHKSTVVKVVCAFLAVLVLFCAMITGSRGALLGIAAVAVIAVISKFRGLWAKIAFCVVMAFLVLAAYEFILTLLPEHIAARFSIQLVLESRGTGRADIWLRAFQRVKETPHMLLMGFGTGSSHYLLDGWAAHNLIIQLLLEVGIVGTGLFLYFLWLWSKRLAKQDPMCLSILAGCMAMAMTLSVNTIYYFWIAFIVGIVCSKAKTDPSGG